MSSYEQLLTDKMECCLSQSVAACGAVSGRRCRLNQQSSRSHAILSLTLQQRAHGTTARTLPAELRCLYSKLHLVDLAGSERAKETGTTGVKSHIFRASAEPSLSECSSLSL